MCKFEDNMPTKKVKTPDDQDEYKPKQILESGSYDIRLYELCKLLPKSWYTNIDNMWNLAGFFFKIPHVEKKLMCKTYILVVHSNTNRFNLNSATSTWNQWVKKPLYNPKVNEANLKSIAGGSNLQSYTEWKNKYEPELIKQSRSKSEAKDIKDQDIKDKLLEITKDTFKRIQGTGIIYQKITDYYYTRKYEDSSTFLNDIFKHEPLYHSISTKEHQNLKYFIENIYSPEFEFVDINFNMIGFNNGIYDLSKAEFISIEDPEFPSNIQVRKYIDMPFEIKVETKYLDDYLRYQFTDEVIDFIYFMCGRQLTVLNDKFDFMVLLYGEGGSGKSLLMNLIKYSFGGGQIGFLSNSLQEKFGLSEFAKKQIVVCDDMPHNIAKVLAKSDFLSMMTRGNVSCPVKGKSSIEIPDWNIPTIINSNQLPNYTDISGEIVRRVMIINFSKTIDEENRNTNLENDIIDNEYPTFLHRCRSTYLNYRNQYKNKSIETFCPNEFIENRLLLREATNNTYQFINDMYEYDKESSIPISYLKQKFKEYLKERFDMKRAPKDSLNQQTIKTVNPKYVVKTLMICKSCSNEHKKDCCSAYDRINRTSRTTICGIKAKPMKFKSDLY